MSLPDMESCPVCAASWIGTPIPVEHRRYHGHKTHFSRLYGIQLPYDHPEHYDGIAYWQCPDCGTEWDRLTEERIRYPRIANKTPWVAT